MAGVILPEFPKGKEFEEYISGLFQAGGYYVERNIIDREGVEILELDIITTDYRERFPNVKLCEVKSKDWHFADLFKVVNITFISFYKLLRCCDGHYDETAFFGF